MKLFVKLMLFVVVLGLVGPFFLKGPDGRPFMDINDFIPDVSGMIRSSKQAFARMTNKVQNIGESGAENTAIQGADGDNVFYRWRDDNGVWQYSDRPPNTIESSEKVVVNPNTNVMDGVKIPEKRDETNATGPGIGVPLPLTISPNQVNELIDDAKGVNELMEKRSEVLDSL